MELPADPKNLFYGIYDKMGIDITKERAKKDPGYWALRDDEPNSEYETPFDMDYGQVW